MSLLQTQFRTDIMPKLKEALGVKNEFQVPAVTKVTVNVGYGRHNKEKSYIDMVEETLLAITGQKPVHNKARKSISNFKIREGADVGMSVTLRGKRMYDFLYRLINLSLPRVRDFRGLSKKGFDRQGNYTLGIRESISFPEITSDRADTIHGLQVVITTTASTKEEGVVLLQQLGMPFKEGK